MVQWYYVRVTARPAARVSAATPWQWQWQTAARSDYAGGIRGTSTWHVGKQKGPTPTARSTYTTMVRVATARMRVLGPPGKPHTMEGSASMVRTPPPLLVQSKGAREFRTTTASATAG